MRLIAFETSNGTRIGEVTGAHVRDIASLEAFYAAPSSFTTAASASAAGESDLLLADLRQVPPVPPTARVFCVGVNYPLHIEEAKESGLEAPTVPMIFGRWASTLVADGDPVPVPPNEEGLDWEAELAVVIGKSTWCASEDDALDSVLGYTGFNDLSARKKQLDTIQWTLGKNADRSGPIGPVLVTADDLDGPPSLNFWTRVNGEVRQQANTAQMVHSIARVISYISDTVTLRPGDVIATGTSDGVGAVMKPPQFLRPGDHVEVEFESIGTLRNPIVEAHEFRLDGPKAVTEQATA